MTTVSDALFAEGRRLADTGDLHGAAEAFEQGLAGGPDDPAVRTRLALIQRSLGDLEPALANFERVLARAPSDVSRINLACALDEAGDSPRALNLLEASQEMLKTSAEARWMAARVWLRAGDYRRGLAMYESRWQLGRPELQLRSCTAPLWRGEAVTGARLLVWHEQGLGDTLLGLRFAALAKARGLRVFAEVQATLRELAASMPGVEAVVTPDKPPPEFDFHIPTLSLPHALGIEVPRAGLGLPCITPPAARTTKWQTLLPRGKSFRIGLAWRSTIYRDNPQVAQSKLARSLPLASLVPFAALPNVELVSLQVAHGSEETGRTPGVALIDLTAHIDDMADTAALMAQLDLVVAIDTSVAHVAGSMGVPLFVLLPNDADWRWAAGDVESPWYPAARTFRQGVRNDWRAPVAAAAAAAGKLAAARVPAPFLKRWFGSDKGG